MRPRSSGAPSWPARLATRRAGPRCATTRRARSPKPGVTFCDVHSAVAYAAAEDTAAPEELSRALREGASAGRLAAGPVVPALVDAFGAFARGDWEATIPILAPVFDQHVRIGGSRAPRDTVELTLLAA